MTEGLNRFFGHEKGYKEKPEIFSSSASDDPKYNVPHSVLLGYGERRHFQAPKRLSSDKLEENIFYIVSVKTGKLYEITQETFCGSPWKISEGKEPTVNDDRVSYLNLSNGKSYRLVEFDQYGNSVLEEVKDQD